MRKISLFSLCFLLILGGCSFISQNNDLNGFCERMNTFYSEELFSPDGYIIDTENNTYYRFFQFKENEVLLKFRYDEEYILNEMNIIFEKDAFNDKNVYQFTENCLKSFITNEENYKNILKEINLKKTLCENTLKSNEAETGNIKMSVDVTDIGSVITVYSFSE